MKSIYVISDSEFDGIQQDIIGIYHKDATPRAKPIAIIVGAQPGSGKSLLQNIAQEELNYNVVLCNLDQLRDFHPFAEDIKTKYEAFYPELTGDNAWRWRENLIAYCIEQRLNFIMEVTFGSGADINNLIRNLKENDYQVNIKLLSVHPLLSLLGTQVRYEEQKEKEDSGRIINKEAHDERYDKLVPSLMMVQSVALYDKLQIYGRNIASNQSIATEGLYLISTNPPDAIQVLQDVFERPWPKKMKTFIEQEIQRVIDLKQARNAPALEISRFKGDMKATYSSPRQMERLALRLLGKLPHIGIAGTDFTVDWPNREIRETDKPANSICLKDMHRTGNGDYFSFFYDLKKHAEHVPDQNLLELPDNVVVIQLPNEIKLDPVAVARENGLDENAFLKEYPISVNLDSIIKPLSESGLPTLITQNKEKYNRDQSLDRDQHISR